MVREDEDSGIVGMPALFHGGQRFAEDPIAIADHGEIHRLNFAEVRVIQFIQAACAPDRFVKIRFVPQARRP